MHTVMLCSMHLASYCIYIYIMWGESYDGVGIWGLKCIHWSGLYNGNWRMYILRIHCIEPITLHTNITMKGFEPKPSVAMIMQWLPLQTYAYPTQRWVSQRQLVVVVTTLGTHQCMWHTRNRDTNQNDSLLPNNIWRKWSAIANLCYVYYTCILL